jgi:deoxyadenosine/deoxycytidine kinase
LGFQSSIRQAEIQLYSSLFRQKIRQLQKKKGGSDHLIYMQMSTGQTTSFKKGVST